MKMRHQMRWTLPKIVQRLGLIEPLVYRRKTALANFRYHPLDNPEQVPPVGHDVDDAAWPLVMPESYWSQWKQNFVLRCQFRIPAEWDASMPIALLLPLSALEDAGYPEALVYVDGTPIAGCDRNHKEIALEASVADGRDHLLALSGWTSNGGFAETPPTRPLVGRCYVVQIDVTTREFIALTRVALGVVQSLDEYDPARSVLLSGLDAAFTSLDTREPLGAARFYDSVPESLATLKRYIDDAGHSLPVTVAATGHAHIDLAWLWTLGQTRNKAARTFHSVIQLMKDYNDFVFTQSQPQLYDYIRQDFPQLFHEIQQKVATGKWEPTGGMWIEADCNLSGAESLARQFLLGQAFFRKHFGEGVASPILWLPDVFGYAWNLPQLIKEAGLEYFFTIKIGWNQYNRLPYDSFWWQGLDGTRVLTHFSATPGHAPGEISTYSARATPDQVIETWKNFQQRESQKELLMAFGYGDGGGGPTREMLENLSMMQDFPGIPRVRFTGAGEFFRKLEKDHGSQLPVWNGELYLEFHRGTYTTQSRNKQANRRSEFMLHDAEFLAVFASVLDTSYHYPQATLNTAWQLTCLNQFHDIIPGSSIAEVYTESMQQYAEIKKLGDSVSSEALQVISAHMDGDIILFNPTSFACTEPVLLKDVVLSGYTLSGADGSPLLTQRGVAGTWIAPGMLGPYNATSLYLTEGETALEASGLIASSSLLENDVLRVEFDATGDITRIYDKANGRDVMPPDSVANQFQAFEDRTHSKWDAWDIEIYYDERCWYAEPASEIKVIEEGPLRATLEVRRRILNSEYTQRISLFRNSARLDFYTEIDWQERHTLLKVAFPVDILSPLATYEIQWGNVQRPIHRNTSWDWARFETCAQKWVDLGEDGYGVSLLNDCKYGHDITDNVIRLSLLRSPSWPDPHADRGQHSFAYSLLPHADGWRQHTVSQAYLLNDPIIFLKRDTEHPAVSRRGALSLVRTDAPNVVIETIKQAEDGDGVIVRLYEAHNRRGEVTLHTQLPVRTAWQTNLLEQGRSQLQVSDKQVRFSIKPYQIMTIKLLFDNLKT
jgi:alpha-mannosidase